MNIEQLRQEVHELDRLILSNQLSDYSHRNSLAKQLRTLEKDIPPMFSNGQEVSVWIAKGRKIKGVVKEYDDNKLVLIQPLDNVYKDMFWTSEATLNVVSELEQLALF